MEFKQIKYGPWLNYFVERKLLIINRCSKRLYDADKDLEQQKARLVAQGFNESIELTITRLFT